MLLPELFAHFRNDAGNGVAVQTKLLSDLGLTPAFIDSTNDGQGNRARNYRVTMTAFESIYQTAGQQVQFVTGGVGDLGVRFIGGKLKFSRCRGLASIIEGGLATFECWFMGGFVIHGGGVGGS